MRDRFLRSLGVALASIFLIPSAAISVAPKTRASSAERAPGQVLVKFRDDAARVAGPVLLGLQQRLGARSIADVRPLMTDHHLAVVRLGEDRKIADALALLADEPAVEYAEPNYVLRALDGVPEDGTPNDPDFSKTWGIRNTGQTDNAGQAGISASDINIVPLWKEGFRGDRKILVAIIDTGLQWDHPDIADNLYTNPGESGAGTGAGIDHDHNGFVNDVHGFNFVTHTSDTRDDNGHGTHCAGTIGGVGNNGVGVSGVNWNVSLMPVKFLDQTGSGTLDAAVEAINYARIMKANVMSNSWGGGGFSQAMFDAISAAKNAGILFVAAAGNDGANSDAAPSYPASYALDNVMSVAATDNRDTLASFSNFGKATVHVAAPGVQVYSTYLGGTYAYLSGTSMATPHASGIAALLMSANPAWSYSEIKNRMIETSDPVHALRSKVIAKGRLDAYNAFHGIIPPSLDPPDSAWQTQAVDLESKHPYDNDSDIKITVNHPGAKYIRLHFSRLEVEASYDHVYFEDASGKVAEDVSGIYLTGYTSDYVMADTAVLHLKTDHTVNTWGYKVDAIQFVP